MSIDHPSYIWVDRRLAPYCCCLTSVSREGCKPALFSVPSSTPRGPTRQGVRSVWIVDCIFDTFSQVSGHDKFKYTRSSPPYPSVFPPSTLCTPLSLCEHFLLCKTDAADVITPTTVSCYLLSSLPPAPRYRLPCNAPVVYWYCLLVHSLLLHVFPGTYVRIMGLTKTS